MANLTESSVYESGVPQLETNTMAIGGPGGGMINYFTPITLTNYDPFQMTSIFNAGYKTGGVQIGFEHSCFHPMQPYATIIDSNIKPSYEGGYNKFFVRISTP